MIFGGLQMFSLAAPGGNIPSEINRNHIAKQSNDNNQLDEHKNAAANLAVENYSFHEYSKSQDASVSIRTREGDEIQFSFYTDYIQTNESAYAQNQNSQSFAQQQSKSFAMGISYAITGDINEQEQAALDELVGQIQQVADKFFSGELEGAFADALNIQYDGSQLSGFQAKLHQSESITAIHEYQAVERLAQPKAIKPPSSEQTASPPAVNIAEELQAKILEAIKEIMDGENQEELSKQPESVTFNDLIDAYAHQQSKKLGPPYKHIFPSVEKPLESILRHALKAHPKAPVNQTPEAPDSSPALNLEKTIA